MSKDKTVAELQMDLLEAKFKVHLIEVSSHGTLLTPLETAVMRGSFFKGVAAGLDMAKEMSSTEETSIVETP